MNATPLDILTGSDSTQTEPVYVHPFERAGLGSAPFRFVGCTREVYVACPGAPIQPGASCDYCGTAIMQACWIVGSDGRRFKVGNECVRKTHGKGERLRTQVERAIAKQRTKATHARQDAKIAELEGWMSDPDARAKLEAAPHPKQWRADEGGTFAEYVEWMIRHAGRAGKVRTHKAAAAVIG
jgi:hypothetical protein